MGQSNIHGVEKNDEGSWEILRRRSDEMGCVRPESPSCSHMCATKSASAESSGTVSRLDWVPSFFYPPGRCGFSDDLIPILVTTLMSFGSDSKAVALFESVSEPASISVALTGNMVILSLLSVTVV